MHLPKRWWIGLPILAATTYFANDAVIPQAEAALRARIAARLAESPGVVDNPQISVTGRDVTIAGVALSPENKDRVFAMLGAESGARTLTDATQAVTLAKPFVLKLERHGARVSISGNMPVSQEREKLRADLAARGFDVSDSASFANGAPSNFGDIAAYAIKRLAELDPAETIVSDATLSVAGEARSSADYDKAIVALKSAPPGAAIKADVTPPRISPYVFSAKLGDGVVSLSGHVPSDDVRRKVVAMAATAGLGAAVSDATQLGGGAPAGYAAAVDFALRELGKFSQGKAVIADGKVSFEGQGRDNVQLATVEGDAKAHLPPGFELARLDVAAGAVSPYVFSAERKNGEVAISGYAPDEATRARLIEAARKRFFDAAVVDHLTVAKGAPPAFAEATDRALGALARLAEGRLAFNGAAVTLSGAARYDAARAEIERGLVAALPQNYRGEALLSTRMGGASLDASQCRAALADIVAKSPVRFGSDDMALAPESAPLVDAIVATALSCRSAAIEIGAYTDNVDIPEVNIARSKRRAQALVDALTKAGVDPFKVTGVGHGAERPVASNDNDENRAHNNRVEFVVK